MNNFIPTAIGIIGLVSVSAISVDNAFLIMRPPISFAIEDIIIDSERGEISVRRQSNVKMLSVKIHMTLRESKSRDIICEGEAEATIERTPDNIWGAYRLAQVIRDDCTEAIGRWVELIIRTRWRGRDNVWRIDEAISNQFYVTEVFGTGG